jgi:signal transduction histidine kinase
MNIRSKLLATFLPLVLVPIAVTGATAVYNAVQVWQQARGVSESLERLDRAAQDTEERIAGIMEDKTISDYTFIARQAGNNLDLRFSHLIKLTETIAASRIMEDFMAGDRMGRLREESALASWFHGFLSTYGLAEISVVDSRGLELIRTGTDVVPPGGSPVFDARPLPNATRDESDSSWFRARNENQDIFVLPHASFDPDFEPPRAVVSFACPLRYRDGFYSPLHGKVSGYLRLVREVDGLVSGLETSGLDFQGRFVLTTPEGVILADTGLDRMVGQVMDDTYPGLDGFHVMTQEAGDRAVRLHLLASRESIRKSSDIVGSLSDSLASESGQAGRLSSEIKDRTMRITQITALVTFCSLALALGLVLYTSRRISRPMANLSRTAARIAHGDLELAPYLPPHAGQELKELAANLDEMRLNLKTQIENLDSLVEWRTQELRQAVGMLQEAKEDAERANRVKTEFLSGVSHELRTPLTSVLGFASMIEDKLDTMILPRLPQDDPALQKAAAKVSRNVGIIVSEAQRLTSLINDVLDISKMEAGKVEYKTEPVDLARILRRACDATSTLAEQRDLDLDCKTSEDLPLVPGDQDRLLQVLINLISNAVKFTDQGSIRCRAYRRGDEAVVAVTDTGRGIAPEDRELVFETFKQVGDSGWDKPSGTGLGLPICKQIVEHHGGRIRVESEPGLGSTFSFTLPLRSGDRAANPAPRDS